jgi:hypothetical protein
MKIGRGNRSTRRKPAPAPLCPPQIPHDQTRVWTRAAAVGSRRLTAWAIARPICQLNSFIVLQISALEIDVLLHKKESKNRSSCILAEWSSLVYVSDIPQWTWLSLPGYPERMSQIDVWVCEKCEMHGRINE